MDEQDASDRIKYMDIDEAIRAKLQQDIDNVIKQAGAQFTTDLASVTESRMIPPAEDYLRAVALQAVFCRMCGADPTDLAEGNPETGRSIMLNLNNIVDAWEKKAGDEANSKA